MVSIVLFVLGTIFGAIVGVGADRVWLRIETKHQRKIEARRLIQGRETEISMAGRAVWSFESAGRSEALYRPAAAPTKPVAVLAGISAPARGIPTADVPIDVADGPRRELPVNARLIQERKQTGARIWDGDILFVEDAELTMSTSTQPFPRLRVSTCNYFSFVSSSSAWRQDLRSSSARRRGTAIAAYADIATLLKNRPMPLILSANALCVFDSEQGQVAALANRSSNVINAVGRLAVVPTYGMEANRRGAAASAFDPLFYNFLKEFLEEYYSSDLEHEAESSAFLPDSIFDGPLARSLISQFEQGSAELVVTGLSAELTDASLVYTLLGRFRSPDFLREVQRNARLNTEWAKTVTFYTVPELRSLLSARPEAFAPSAAYCIDRALLALSS